MLQFVAAAAVASTASVANTADTFPVAAVSPLMHSVPQLDKPCGVGSAANTGVPPCQCADATSHLLFMCWLYNLSLEHVLSLLYAVSTHEASTWCVT